MTTKQKSWPQLKTNGVTRTVFLVGKYAVKIPCVHRTYAMFIEGIRSNLAEGRFVGYEPQAPIARTLYSNRFGLLNIQERVRPVSGKNKLFRIALVELSACEFFNRDFIMDDPKPDNFGYKQNKLVKIDYGN